jgi:hypothetical protein
MSEPDFAGLRTVAEQAVRQPEFATIEWLAGRRRGRLRLAAAAAVAVAVTAVAGTTALAINRAAPGPALPGPTSSAPAGSQLTSYGGDGDHLYLTFGCDSPACPALYASDDGGRHWERRTLPNDDQPAFGPAVLGPRTLLMSASDPDATPTPEPFLNDAPRLLYGSTDGGATWRRVGTTTTPIESVPADQRLLECISLKASEPCAVQTLDADLRTAPLANQPPIAVLYVPAYPPASAGLWVSGFDRSTRKPALAVSHDRGRTWKVTVFTAVAPVDDGGGFIGVGNLPEVYTADGRTAYVMQTRLMGTDEPQIYRTTDGGDTWRLIHQGEKIQSFAFVTRDGAHVLFEQDSDGVAIRRASHNGGPYRPAVLFGLPGSGSLIGAPTSLGDGRGYLAQSAMHPYELYVSDDGWTYRRLAVPPG